MRKLFICLANSKKYGERCIAGVEVEKKADEKFHIVKENGLPKWVRPVTNVQHGEVPTTLVDDMKLLEIYEMDIIKPCPKGYQSENELFYKNSLKKIKAIEDMTSHKLSWLIEKEKDCLFFGKGKAVSKDNIQNVKQSLCLIKGEHVNIYAKQYREWEIPKPRIAFDYKGTTYDLPITDVAFLEAYAKDKTIVERADNTFITVSLGAEHENWFYKLAAGIICI